jgi:hypothetical protein
VAWTGLGREFQENSTNQAQRQTGARAWNQKQPPATQILKSTPDAPQDQTAAGSRILILNEARYKFSHSITADVFEVAIKLHILVFYTTIKGNILIFE